MRKTLLVITVLLVATQAYAGNVTLSAVDASSGGERWASIRYSADANVSAFGLKVTADSGAIFTGEVKDYNVGECTATVQGYGIFPGTIVIDESNGVVESNGTPIAPNSDPGASGTGPNTGALVLEMGTLYVEGNEPALSGTLVSVKVDKDCTVCVDTEPVRGNVVLTDANEANVTYDPCCVHLQIDYDYGDADDAPYPTLWASTPNGARHVAIGPMLGANRDIELDGQPSADCLLDDTTGVPDDEDGITALVVTPAIGTVTVTVTGTCLLNAWIDFDHNGNWTDAGDQIFTDQPLVAGPNTLTFPVPADPCICSDLISRWRVSTAGGDDYYGEASDGEVEDYNQPHIICHVPDVVGDPCDEAIAELIANGFVIGDIIVEYNDYVPWKYVISTDPAYCNYPGCGTDVNLVVSGGSECYLGQPDEAEWTEAGRPTCWCYPRQCHGDADGLSSGSYYLGYAYVNTADLDIMSLGWQVKDPPKGSGILNQFVNGVPVACADFNHDKVGSYYLGYNRIGTTDLDLMSLYWLKREPPKGSGTPANCVPGNRIP